MTTNMHNVMFIAEARRSQDLVFISIPFRRAYTSELDLYCYLYRSHRARNILLTYTHGRRHFRYESILIHHPLFSTPLILRVDTNHACVRRMLRARITFLRGLD